MPAYPLRSTGRKSPERMRASRTGGSDVGRTGRGAPTAFLSRRAPLLPRGGSLQARAGWVDNPRAQGDPGRHGVMQAAEAEILAANEAFYRAFAGRNFAAMDALWARRAPVV